MLDAARITKTLEIAREHRLLDEREARAVLAAFESTFPLSAAAHVADSMHVHVKVDDVAALPHAALLAAGGRAENAKDGYVKYAFPSGMNLIFSSIAVSEDDRREKPESRRRRPFLDHYGLDLRRSTPDVKRIFDGAPSIASRLGWSTASQGGDDPVFCCHTSVAAKHWLFPTAKEQPPIEIAFGPLTVQEGKSGCDLRPSNPSHAHAPTPACCPEAAPLVGIRRGPDAT
jgi:hypothetical protein